MVKTITVFAVVMASYLSRAFAGPQDNCLKRDDCSRITERKIECIVNMHFTCQRAAKAAYEDLLKAPPDQREALKLRFDAAAKRVEQAVDLALGQDIEPILKDPNGDYQSDPKQWRESFLKGRALLETMKGDLTKKTQGDPGNADPSKEPATPPDDQRAQAKQTSEPTPDDGAPSDGGGSDGGSNPRGESSDSRDPEFPGGNRLGDGSKEKMRRGLDLAKAGAASWKGGGAGLDAAGSMGDRRGPSGPGAPGPGSAAPAELDRPRTGGELILAAVGPFKGAAQALGLKVGTGPDGRSVLFGSDGGLASAAALEDLRLRIEREPASLLKRPDFFDVLPRESFDALKDEYRKAPERREGYFKHMSLEPPKERDFLFSASCEVISGDCNRYVDARSYRRGDFVSPEDLRRIAEMMREVSTDAAAPENAAKGKLASRIPVDMRSKVLGVLSATFQFLKGVGSTLPWAAPASRTATVRGRGADGDWGPRQPVEFTGKPVRTRGQPPQAGPVTRGPKAGWGWWILLAAALAGAGLFVGWRRRRGSTSSRAP